MQVLICNVVDGPCLAAIQYYRLGRVQAQPAIIKKSEAEPQTNLID
jgi:hypothetical protein